MINGFTKFLMGQMLIMDEKKEGDGGGGAGPTKEEFAKMQSDYAALSKKFDDMESKSKVKTEPETKEDPTLADKARLAKEETDKKAAESGKLERALKFTMGGPEWLKTNAALLPKTVAGIFEQAEKENYGSATEKSAAVKVSVISEFFSQQANLDLLTGSQKEALEEFKKLTKTDKQEKADQIFDSIFEPTFESLKKIKKAELMSKGYRENSSVEESYKEKLMNGSKKHYLGEKS